MSPCLVNQKSSRIQCQPTSTEEVLLVQQLLTGDPRGWRQFAQTYSRMIEACIARIVTRFPGLVGHEDVHEIYALFCLNLLANNCHKLRSFDPLRGTRFGSFLAIIAVHTAYDYLRTVRRQPQGPSVDDIAEIVAHVPEAAENCERMEQARQVARLVSELSERDRQFMTLYFGQGLSAEQVAAQMGISVKTVYTKKHKIRNKLESMVGQPRVAA